MSGWSAGHRSAILCNDKACRGTTMTTDMEMDSAAPPFGPRGSAAEVLSARMAFSMIFYKLRRTGK